MIKLNLTNEVVITNEALPIIFDGIVENTDPNITYNTTNGEIAVNGNILYRASMGDQIDDVMKSFLLEVETIDSIETSTNNIVKEISTTEEPPIIEIKKTLPNFRIKFNLHDKETDTFLRTMKEFPIENDILPIITNETSVDLDCTFTYIRKNTDSVNYILKVVNEGEGNVKIKAGNILTLETL